MHFSNLKTPSGLCKIKKAFAKPVKKGEECLIERTHFAHAFFVLKCSQIRIKPLWIRHLPIGLAVQQKCLGNNASLQNRFPGLFPHAKFTEPLWDENCASEPYTCLANYLLGTWVTLHMSCEASVRTSNLEKIYTHFHRSLRELEQTGLVLSIHVLSSFCRMQITLDAPLQCVNYAC